MEFDAFKCQLSCNFPTCFKRKPPEVEKIASTLPNISAAVRGVGLDVIRNSAKETLQRFSPKTTDKKNKNLSAAGLNCV